MSSSYTSTSNSTYRNRGRNYYNRSRYPNRYDSYNRYNNYRPIPSSYPSLPSYNVPANPSYQYNNNPFFTPLHQAFQLAEQKKEMNKIENLVKVVESVQNNTNTTSSATIESKSSDNSVNHNQNLPSKSQSQHSHSHHHSSHKHRKRSRDVSTSDSETSSSNTDDIKHNSNKKMKVYTDIIKENTKIMHDMQQYINSLHQQSQSSTPSHKHLKRKSKSVSTSNTSHSNNANISISSNDSVSSEPIIIPVKRTATKEREYQKQLSEKIAVLTEKYKGRSSKIRNELEQECASYKIMPITNRKKMIELLAKATTH